MQKKHCPLLALLLALAMVLTACGQDQNTGSQGADGEGDLFTVTAAVSQAQDTLDPERAPLRAARPSSSTSMRT